MRSYLSSPAPGGSHGAQTPQRALRLSPIAGKREKLVRYGARVTHVPIAFMAVTISHVWGKDTPGPCYDTEPPQLVVNSVKLVKTLLQPLFN